jgi:hypothetical protein
LNCDDGNACNGAETCSPATGCVAGTALTCDDGNVCNGVETCSPATGCVAGTALTCNDGNVCTADLCDPVVGCYKTINMDATSGSFSEHRVDGRDLVVLANAWNSCLGDASGRYDLASDLDPVSTLPNTGACVDDGDFHQFMMAFGHNCPL